MERKTADSPTDQPGTNHEYSSFDVGSLNEYAIQCRNSELGH